MLNYFWLILNLQDHFGDLQKYERLILFLGRLKIYFLFYGNLWHQNLMTKIQERAARVTSCPLLTSLLVFLFFSTEVSSWTKSSIFLRYRLLIQKVFSEYLKIILMKLQQATCWLLDKMYSSISFLLLDFIKNEKIPIFPAGSARFFVSLE